MSRRLLAVVIGLVVSAGVGAAQPPTNAPAPRFKWQPGQTLTYKIGQQTVVQETITDEKTDKPTTTETRTTLALTRTWAVKEVDATGTATLEMRIVEMKNEIRQADGSTVVRDSSNPEHAKEMAEYLNTPVMVVRVDARGQLAEIKEAKPGSTARLHAELPFRMVLPDTAPAAGQTWDRTFAVRLDPPLGTGESHEFAQKYTCKDVKDGLAVVGVETALKAPPKAPGDQIPLIPMLWTGEVYFNAVAGKYHAARLTTRTELTNHLGEGSKFVYQSSYTEDAVEK